MKTEDESVHYHYTVTGYLPYLWLLLLCMSMLTGHNSDDRTSFSLLSRRRRYRLRDGNSLQRTGYFCVVTEWVQ